MKILIIGGTGFLGTALTKKLIENLHQVCILTRDSKKQAGNSKNPEYLYWNGAELPPLPELDVLINLAGAPIQKGRWTAKRKKLILESRVHTTELICQAIQNGSLKPKLFLSGSALGYYGEGECRLLSESSPKGEGFLSTVADQWEAAALKCKQNAKPELRLVLLRTGVVLGDGGALSLMALPFKLGLGGPLGSGNQYLPWIHLDDWVGIVLQAMNHSELSGPINLCSPKPVTMEQFARELAKVLKRPCVFRVPKLLLKLILGELSEVVLYSQNAAPEKILETGYVFKHPQLRSALQQIFIENSL